MLRMALWHPRVTYSPYVDHKHRVVLDGINASEYRERFWGVLNHVLVQTNSFEKVDVTWWYYPYVYIDVVDTRWKHYPCGHRFLVSFDLSNGLIASKDSDNRYVFARKGWGAYADRLVGYSVPRYSDCGCKDKTNYC